MDSRIGRYACLVMVDGKLDLYRDDDRPNETRAFDSISDAEEFMGESGLEKYNVVEIVRDTF